MSSFPVICSQFATTEYCRKHMIEHYSEMSPTIRDTIAGSIGGMVSNCFFVTPDLLKSRAQMTKDGRMSYRREFARIV